MIIAGTRQAHDEKKKKKEGKISTIELCTKGTMFAAGGLGPFKAPISQLKPLLKFSGEFWAILGSCYSFEHMIS